MYEQHAQAKEEYKDAILERLLEHYLTNEPLPGKEEEPLTITLVHRLYRSVLAEGYGQ